jgi:hypothetical protein
MFNLINGEEKKRNEIWGIVRGSFGLGYFEQYFFYKVIQYMYTFSFLLNFSKKKIYVKT